MTPSNLATAIERISSEINDEHYGIAGGSLPTGGVHPGPHATHYRGGPSHNDDRLTADVSDSGSVHVTDGNAHETIDPELTHLLVAARDHVITPAEHEAQRRSWAYGNAAIDDDSVTREMVDEVADAQTDKTPNRRNGS